MMTSLTAHAALSPWRNTNHGPRRYDKQLKEKVGFDPDGKTTEEKMKADYGSTGRNSMTSSVTPFTSAAGWNNNGIPTIEHLKRIVLDPPEVIEVGHSRLQ
ncbi:MAG: hypothetical protein MZV63_55005 [Marinilabiliales bacterium]|nr:hypothetical protein [Marinilabiliales bacterium]